MMNSWIKFIFIVALFVASFGVASAATRPLYLYSTNSLSVSSGDYNLGYKFTPNVDGTIDKLWVRADDTDTYTARLYNSAGTVIASTSVTGVVDTWAGTSITPVTVTKDDWYVVAYRTSGNWKYDGTNIALPTGSGQVTINEGRYISASDAIPTSVTTVNLYQADVTFTPTESTVTRVETPYRTREGTPGTQPTGDYMLGNVFIPTQNGTISKVAGRFPTTDSYTLRIFDVASGSELASKAVTGVVNTWVSGDLASPLSVTAGTRYIIGARHTNGYYLGGTVTPFDSEHIKLGNGFYSAATNTIPITNWSYQATVDITFTPSLNALGAEKLQTVLDPSVSGATNLSTDPNDYNLGHEFKVKTDGTIDKLWMKVPDTNSHTVRLWRVSDSAELASVSITGVAGTWVSGNITPVNVTNESNYIVSVRVGAGNSYYYYAQGARQVGNVSMVAGRYIAASNAFPSNSSGANVYGLTDVSFTPDNTQEPHADIAGTTNASGDYNLGTSFYPAVDGTITKLWARVPNTNTNTVRLYDSNQNVIASASVVGVVGSWVGVDITPVAVTGREWYIVAVRTASYYYQAFPSVARINHIQVKDSRYIAASNAFPRTYDGTYYYGADVSFLPGEAAGGGTSPVAQYASFILKDSNFIISNSGFIIKD